MKRTVLCIILFLPFSFANAQSITPEVIATAGEHYIGSQAQVSWTMGEVVIETVIGTNAIITQGFHQPDSMVVGVEELANGNWQFAIYPNPSRGAFVIEGDASLALSMTVYDIIGKEIWKGQMIGGRRVIDLTGKANGMYFLNVSNEVFNSTYKIQLTK